MLFRSSLLILLAGSSSAFQAPARSALSVGPTKNLASLHMSKDVQFFEKAETTAAETTKSAINGAAAVTAPVVDYSKISMLDTPAAAFQTLAGKGEANAKASNMKTLVSAMLGGAYVGMGGMLSLAVAGNMAGIAGPNPGLGKFVFAALFPVNLLLALQCGGQLFTGNTANMAAAVCEKRATMKNLLRSWALSWTGNLIACSTFACLCKYAGVLNGGAGALAASTLAAKTSMALGPTIVKAILCNWLVCLAVYLSMQAKDMTGKYVSIWLCISTFVSIGFEHSVANMFLLPAGLLSTGSITVKTALLKNLIPVTIGNLISGSLLVGVMFSYMFGRLGEGK